jgi:hypothetical protein
LGRLGAEALGLIGGATAQTPDVRQGAS